MTNFLAKVCPWDVPNSYGEIMPKGVFSKFLKTNPLVPMLIMHTGRAVGVWHQFEERDDGLWAHGMTPVVPTKEMLDGVPEVSIAWRSADGIMTERRFEDCQKCGIFVPPRVSLVNEHAPRNAGLGEISLVDKGAFKGTYYTVQA